MKLFECGFIAGTSSTEAVSEENKELMELLVENAMMTEQQETDETIPKYVMDMFNHMLKQTKYVSIEFGSLNCEIFCVYPDGDISYGYERVKHLYLEEDSERIKWNVLRALFPCIQQIIIVNKQRIENTMNGAKYVESVLLTEEWLDSISAYLVSTKAPIKWISIRNPKNEDVSLQRLISKYSVSFQRIGFKLLLEDLQSERYGAYKEFAVEATSQ